MKHVFLYGDLVFVDLDEAKDAANVQLQKHFSEAVYYDWEKNPLINLAFDGVIWRGQYLRDCIRFTVDIIERRVS